MAKTDELDIDAVLSGAASGKPKGKSKSKTPRVEIPSLVAEVKRWRAAKQATKDAEAEMAAAEEKIIPLAIEHRKKECRREGKFDSAVVVNGEIQVVSQNKYSKIDKGLLAELTKVFGADAEKMFAFKREVSLTQAALNDKEILKKLIAAVGAENFRTFFEVTEFYVPTDVLHEGIVLDESIDKKASRLVEAGVLKQSKPSIRVA